MLEPTFAVEAVRVDSGLQLVHELAFHFRGQALGLLLLDIDGVGGALEAWDLIIASLAIRIIVIIIYIIMFAIYVLLFCVYYDCFYCHPVLCKFICGLYKNRVCFAISVLVLSCVHMCYVCSLLFF